MPWSARTSAPSPARHRGCKKTRQPPRRLPSAMKIENSSAFTPCFWGEIKANDGRLFSAPRGGPKAHPTLLQLSGRGIFRKRRLPYPAPASEGLSESPQAATPTIFRFGAHCRRRDYAIVYLRGPSEGIRGRKTGAAFAVAPAFGIPDAGDGTTGRRWPTAPFAALT